MSGTFNGYHVWLGIPPNEQPPNHYRLLGIAAFEKDLDVIEHAADRQMAHVRTFQAGKHGALSQQILNELAAARLCLLSPEKKAAYDHDLREQLQGDLTDMPVARSVPVVKAVPVAKPVAKSPKKPAPAADELAMDLDTYAESFPSGGPAFTLPVKRRKYNQSAAGKNAAILGILMAAVVITGMCLYYFSQKLLSTADWQEIFGISPSPAAPGGETPGGSEPKGGGPPSPAPEKGQP